MAILNIQTSQTGEAGVLPSYASILTDDTEAAVLTTGYLNKAVQNGASFAMPCIAKIATKASSTSPYQVGWYQISRSGTDWSVIPAGNPGEVVLPTVANRIATYTNTTGTLSEDAATAINGGNLQAGLSGTAGYLASFPSAASKGSFRVTAVANTGDTLTTLSNVAMGQASVISIPDPVNAVGRLLVGATATPFATGRILASSGTGGLVADSGIATTAVQLNTNIKAVRSADIGGAGAGPITITQAGVVATSVITANIVSSSNTVSIAKVTPGTGDFTVLFDADPGAACVINYIVFIAQQ